MNNLMNETSNHILERVIQLTSQVDHDKNKKAFKALLSIKFANQELK